MRRLAPLLAFAVFAFMWVRPLDALRLRRQLRRSRPDAWAALPTNGSFAFLLPFLSAGRFHDESTYAAPVNQILRHGLPLSPYWAGHREFTSWSHDFVSYYLVAAAAWLSGKNVTTGWLLAQALTAAAWAALFYLVFLWWCGKPRVAAPLALASALFPDVYIWLLDVNLDPAVDWDRLKNVFVQTAASRPVFYRMPTPFLSYLLVCLLLLAAWRLAQRKSPSPVLALATGAGFAALAFVHAFEHAFGVAALCCFAAALWLARAPAPARANLTLAAAAAAALSGVYFLVMSRASSPQARAETLGLLGLVHSHRFFKVTAVHLAFAALAWRWQSRESAWPRRAAWLLLAGAQAAGFFCRNSQVATGLMLHPSHYIGLASFTGCAMLALRLSQWLSERRWWDRRAAWTLAAAAAGLALFNEASAAERTYKLMGLPRDTEAALSWVRDHAPDDAVFLSLSSITNATLPIYTQAKVLVPPVAVMPTVLYTRDDYLRLTARLLRTMGADVDVFVEKRWPLPAEQAAIGARETAAQLRLGKADEGALDPLEWASCFPYGNASDAPILDARQRIKGFWSEAAPADGPYFVWVNARDVPLLPKFPAMPGARLVYRNPSVWIYSRP